MMYRFAIDAILIVLTAATFIFNMTVLLALVSHRRQTVAVNLQSFSLTLTTSLVVVDILIAVLVMPVSIADFDKGFVWPYGVLVCKLHVGSDFILCTASILHLTALAADRYLAVCRPFVHRRLTTKTARVTCLVLWGLAVIGGTIPVYFTSVVKDRWSTVTAATEVRVFINATGNTSNCNIIDFKPENRGSRDNSGLGSRFTDNPTSSETNYTIMFREKFASSELSTISGAADVTTLFSGNFRCLNCRSDWNAVNAEQSQQCKTYVRSPEFCTLMFVTVALPSGLITALHIAILRRLRHPSRMTAHFHVNRCTSSDVGTKHVVNENERRTSVESKRAVCATECGGGACFVYDVSKHVRFVDTNSAASTQAKGGTGDIFTVEGYCEIPTVLLLSATKTSSVTPSADAPAQNEIRDAGLCIPTSRETIPYLATRSSPKEKQMDQATKSVFFLVVAFFLCWLPYFMFVLTLIFVGLRCSEEVELGMCWLNYFHSTINPLLYYRFNSTIRKAIRRLLKLH